jgi:hypothetical protein
VGGVIERGVKTVGVEEAVEFETFRGFSTQVPTIWPKALMPFANVSAMPGTAG